MILFDFVWFFVFVIFLFPYARLCAVRNSIIANVKNQQHNNNNNNNNNCDEQLQRADTAASPPRLLQRQDQERKLSVSNITVIKAHPQMPFKNNTLMWKCM